MPAHVPQPAMRLVSSVLAFALLHAAAGVISAQVPLASGALARFDADLASGSTELREEAMAGRATALERLGRNEDESRAWTALLAAYPGTPYAAHAKVRVARTASHPPADVGSLPQ